MDIQEYITKDGRSPFGTWLRGLRDVQARARIRVRLDRVRLDNLGIIVRSATESMSYGSPSARDIACTSASLIAER